jgi:hypothetical protein
MKTNIISRIIQSFIALFAEEHMRPCKSIAIVFMMVVLSMAVSCSKDDPKYGLFQNNTGSTDPLGGDLNPFTGLPNLGDPTFAEEAVAAIGELFNPGSFNLTQDAPDYQAFVDDIKEIVANPAPENPFTDTNKFRRQAAYDVLTIVVPHLADDYGTGHGTYGLMAALRNIVGYIINQESLDDTSGSYIDELYTYLNKIDDASLDMKPDIYKVLFKTLAYIDDTYPSAIKENLMADLRTFLADNSGQTFTSLLMNLQEGTGKILLRSDSYIQYDDPQDGTGVEDTGLGNAVTGVDFLLTGLTDMISTNNTYDGPAVRQNLYDVLGELGKLLNSSSFKDVLRNLLKNIEDYFTFVGSVYQPSAEYHNASNPYVNAEIRNTVKEIWPTLVKLFIRERTHPDYSPITTGGSRSPIELLTRSLHKLKDAGIDYSDTANYSLEDSLENLVKYNAYGEDRTTASYKVSYLDHLLFTCAAGYNFGYLTRNSCSGEPYDNLSHGHGVSTKGVLTINDTMYSLVNREMGTLVGNKDSYNLALDIRTWQGERTWRGYTYFANASKAGKEFYLGKDYPALCLLPSGCIGDFGIPNGGIKALTPTGDNTSGNDYKTYFPYAADGKGMGNTAYWLMSWVARICLDGAGPYYSTQGAYQTNNAGNGSLPDWPGKGSTNYWVYFKPNGEVYAYVDKNAATWVNYYPATGNDVVDTKAVNDPYDSSLEPNGQRFNRYRSKLISDYFLLQEGDNGNYSAPPMNARGAADGLVENNNPANSDCFHLTVSSTRQPHHIRLFEKLQEARQADNVKRECASQEIAMYRNFQWLMLEKKFVFVIPMIIRAGMLTCWINSNALIVMEANGFLGQANIKKSGNSSTDGYWVLRGDRGDLSQSDGVTSNNPDYGDSSYRGDARILVWARYDSLLADTISPEVIWDNVLGNAAATSGYVLPDVIGRNLAPVVNMAFTTQDCRGPNMGTGGGTNFQNTIASDSTAIGDNGQLIWQNRSKIFPILVALFGVLMDGSYYEVAGSGANYNYSAAAVHKYPLLDVLEGLLIPLSKPLTRYYTDSESWTTPPGASASTGRWVPRLNSEPTINGQTRFDYFQPIVSGSVDYRPRSALRTLPSFLADQTVSTYDDGLISIMADTKIVTKLVSLLQRMGDYDGASSPYRDVADGGSGILENVSKGLEQILTSMQVARSEASSAGRSWLGYTDPATTDTRSDRLLNNWRYGWMFTDVNDRRVGTPISVDLGVLLDELIGDNTKGLSKFVDDREVVEPNGSGTGTVATVSNITTITDASKSWTANQWAYKYVEVDNVVYLIASNTATVLTINGPPNPVGGSKAYKITKWSNYYTALDAIGQMMGNSASPYYIAGNESTHGTLIHIINNLLTGVTMTSADRLALRHTLGILMARYPSGGPWTTNVELRDILQHYLPEVLTSATGHYDNFIITLKSLMDKDNNGVVDDPEDLAIMNYLVDLLIHGDRAEEIIPEMYDLLSNNAMWDSAYYNSTYPNKATLKELVDICEELSLEIEDL